MLSRLQAQYLWSPRRALRRWRRRGPVAGPRRAELPWGLHLTVDPGEAIGSSLWRQGLYDPVLTETLWRLMEPGWTAVDGGANIGYISALLALRAGPTGRVLAFEPHPQIFTALRVNLDGLADDPRLAPIEIRRQALTERNGTGELVWHRDALTTNRGLAHLSTAQVGLEGTAGNGNEKTERVTVETLRLDDVPGGELGERVLIKLDLEGAEPDALRGATGHLAHGRIRHVVYEAHDGDASPCHAILRRHGYAVRALGRTLTGLALAELGEPVQALAHDPVNYVATREPDNAFPRLSARGWRSF